VRLTAALAAISAGLALGACSYLGDFDSFRLPNSANLLTLRQVTSYKDKPLAPIVPEDLVDGQGRCAGAFVPADTSGGQLPLNEAGVPMIPSAIALEMTECDVVKRAGVAQQVDIGANPAGERTATLIYLSGPRPGTYRFAGGRLKSMERGPEPPPEAKPARKPKAKKKKTASG
jgi:hypothetical protein